MHLMLGINLVSSFLKDTGRDHKYNTVLNVYTEGHRNESREASRSNPADNVNAQLATALTQIAEYFKRQETRAETLEIAEDIALECFQKFGPPRFNGKGIEIQNIE